MESIITSDLFLNTIGLYASFLLILMLIVKEYVRTANPPWASAWMRGLDYVIMPLFILFALTAIGRVMSL